MRSRTERLAFAFAFALTLACVPPLAAQTAASANAAAGASAAVTADPARAASAAAPVSVASVRAATAALAASGDLGGTRKEQSWRFRRDDDEPPEMQPTQWLVDLARFLAESGRWLVWLVGAAGLALVVVAARRWIAIRGDATAKLSPRLPSQVRDLDIRPESLPDDVGAAVRTLWLDGERRAALSLLYRGALSRLVHAHGIAIADSSTEGDCIRLARDVLPGPAGEFVARLIAAWQLAVYGNRALETPAVLALCEQFDRFLPARPAATAA